MTIAAGVVQRAVWQGVQIVKVAEPDSLSSCSLSDEAIERSGDGYSLRQRTVEWINWIVALGGCWHDAGNHHLPLKRRFRPAGEADVLFRQPAGNADGRNTVPLGDASNVAAAVDFSEQEHNVVAARNAERSQISIVTDESVTGAGVDGLNAGVESLKARLGV